MSIAYDRQLFLKVKEKLDLLHLGSAFAIEDLGLIAKLIAKIEEKDDICGFRRRDWNDETQEHTRDFTHVEEALNMEIKRLLKENSLFRRELWQAKEETQEFKIKLINKIDAKLEKEGRQIDQIRILDEKNRREKQLLEELEEIRYKYNQLMELIHESPQFEREYIKRLIKFKKSETGLKNQGSALQSSKQNVVFDKNSLDARPVFDQISLLKSKIYTRQQEILRLQTLIEQNNNYIHFRYEQGKQTDKQFLLNQEIRKLTQENQQLQKILTINKLKIKISVKSDKETVDKEDILTNRYDYQFKIEKKQSDSFILEHRYANDEKSSRKEKQQENKSKAKGGQTKNGTSNEAGQKKDRKSQSIASEYYDNAENNQYHQTKRYKSPTIQTKQLEKTSKNKYYISNTKVQSKSIKKGDPKPSIPHNPSNKNISSPVKNEKLIANLQKLIEQKNNHIIFLEEQLKNTPHTSTKIISTQNINATNNPGNNLIIKTNKNEYININNINSNDNNPEIKRKTTRIQSELANAAKERENLEERVKNLQKDKSKEKEQEDHNNIEENHNENYSIEYQILRKKLVQTQNALVKTNQQNLDLQKQLNHLILTHKKHSSPTIQHESKQIIHLSSEQLRIELIFLRKEVSRLRIEVQGYISQRQILLARLKELEISLHKQTSQMRCFEEQIYIRSQSVSIASSVKELENQSQVHLPYR